ncbi:hypothetical protein ACEWY4_024004 [Coilia grayii]|uniref:Uncharacterized protein n=1 Tax=Coilia grayii TaxID=363190 RepID=A0ABD1J270_9TELE
MSPHPEESSLNIQGDAEQTKLTSVHVYQSKIQDSLTDRPLTNDKAAVKEVAPPTGKPGPERCTPEESSADQADVILLASMTFNNWDSILDVPLAVPEDDSEFSSLPCTSSTPTKAPDQEMPSSKAEPAAPSHKAVLPLVEAAEDSHTKSNKQMNDVTPVTPEPSDVSPADPVSAVTVNETTPHDGGSSSSQIIPADPVGAVTLNEARPRDGGSSSSEIIPAACSTDMPTFNDDQSVLKLCSSGIDKIVSDFAILNNDITTPKADASDAVPFTNSEFDTAELANAGETNSPNIDMHVPECNKADSTVGITYPDPEPIRSDSSADIITDKLAYDVAILNTDITSPKTDISDAAAFTDSTFNTAQPNNASNVHSPSTDIVTAECEVTETTVDITALNPKPIRDDSSADIPDKLVPDVTILNTDIRFPKEEFSNENAFTNSMFETAEVANANDINSPNTDTVMPECEVTVPTIDITAPNPEPIRDDSSAGITDRLVSDVTILNSDITVTTVDITADLTDKLVSDDINAVNSPSTYTVTPECAVTETTADITAQSCTSHPEPISNAISSDITHAFANVNVSPSETTEHLVADHIMSSSITEIPTPLSDIDVSCVSTVDLTVPNADTADMIDTAAENDEPYVTDTTIPVESAVVCPEIPSPNCESTASSLTEAAISDSTADTMVFTADITNANTTEITSVTDSDITIPNADIMSLPKDPMETGSASVISDASTLVSRDGSETESHPSDMPQHEDHKFHPPCPECPGLEPVPVDSAQPEPATLTCFPQATGSDPVPPEPQSEPGLTCPTASSNLECSDVKVSPTDSSLRQVEAFPEAFSHFNPDAEENLTCESNTEVDIKESDLPLFKVQGPCLTTETSTVEELVPSAIISLSNPSKDDLQIRTASSPPSAHISPALSHSDTTQSHSGSRTEVEAAMVKEVESAERGEECTQSHVGSRETGSSAPADLRSLSLSADVNKTKDGRSGENAWKTSLVSLEEHKTNGNHDESKSSEISEHFTTPKMKEVTDFTNAKALAQTTGPLLQSETVFEDTKETSAGVCETGEVQGGIQNALADFKSAHSDELTECSMQQHQHESTFHTSVMPVVENSGTYSKSFAEIEGTYVRHAVLSDSVEGVDGDRTGEIAAIPLCPNTKTDSLCSESTEVDCSTVASFAEAQFHEQETGDAATSVPDKRIEVMPMEKQMEVSESIVLAVVHQKGMDQKEILEEMSDNNCSMDGGSYIQEELLFQVTREMKQEHLQKGNLEAGSHIEPAWEPAAPVDQVCEAAECDSAPPSSQEPTEERVWGASLSSSRSLATFPEPLPQATGEITEAERCVGRETMNDMHESQTGASDLIFDMAEAEQILPANTHQLPDTETHNTTTTTTATQHASANTLLSTGTIRHTEWQREPSSSADGHAHSTHSPSVQLITADIGTRAEVPSVAEPRRDTLTDRLAGTTTTTPTDTGLPKLHR